MSKEHTLVEVTWKTIKSKEVRPGPPHTVQGGAESITAICGSCEEKNTVSGSAITHALGGYAWYDCPSCGVQIRFNNETLGRS